MTMVPNPVLYAAVARERQTRFRSRRPAGRPDGSARGMRVRIGRLLISAGTTISGDSIELRPRRSARRSHAA